MQRPWRELPLLPAPPARLLLPPPPPVLVGPIRRFRRPVRQLKPDSRRRKSYRRREPNRAVRYRIRRQVLLAAVVLLAAIALGASFGVGSFDELEEAMGFTFDPTIDSPFMDESER
jgi:hypothetical protein